MGQRVVGRHIRNVGYDNEIRARRHPVALHDGFVLHHVCFEDGEVFGRLYVECDFADGGQAVAQPFGVNDGDLFFDDAGLDQPPDTAQAGGGRGMYLLGQFLVGQAGIAL